MMNDSLSATLEGLMSFFGGGSSGGSSSGSKRKREDEDQLKNGGAGRGGGGGAWLQEELLVPNPLLASSASRASPPAAPVPAPPAAAPVVVVSSAPNPVLQQPSVVSAPNPVLQPQPSVASPVGSSSQQKKAVQVQVHVQQLQLAHQQLQLAHQQIQQSPTPCLATSSMPQQLQQQLQQLQQVQQVQQQPPNKKAKTTVAVAAASASPQARTLSSPHITFKLPVGVGIKVPTVAQPPVQPTMCGSSSNSNSGVATNWGGVPTITPGGATGTSVVALARKERNRQAAKQSRIRKKNEEEFLKSELAELQKENMSLRKLIKAELKDSAAEIIGQDCYNFAKKEQEQASQAQPGHYVHHIIPNGSSASTTTTTMGYNDFELIESLTKEGEAFVLTDPRLPDNPIVYASPKFFQLTQYSREQVIGRNCRFLQGPQTCPKALQQIRNAIASGEDCTVRLLNFKQDGTPFWNHFFLAALRDKNSKIVNYVGVQTAITAPTPEELERMNNLKETSSTTTATSQGQAEPTSTQPPVPSAAVVPVQKVNSRSSVITNSRGSLALPPPVTTTTAGTTSTTTTTTEEQGGGDQFRLDWAELAKSLEADFFDGGNTDNYYDDNMQENDVMDLNFDFDNDNPVSGSFHNSFVVNHANDDDQFMAPFNPLEEEEEETTGIIDTAQQTTTAVAVGVAAAPPTTTATATTTTLPQPPSLFPPPRWLVTQTVKSELVDSLLVSHGNTTTERFTRALDLLAAIHRSKQQNEPMNNESLSPLIHGDNWRSLSRPSYSGCLGQTDEGDFVYTLGKMSFNMFKPGNLRCTVQRSMTLIQPVCEMDKSPRAAPFSLRRELADAAATASSNDYTSNSNDNPENGAMLKSYDISIALTIESSDFFRSDAKEDIPAPPCRLRALQLINGYYLPDPSTPNRLTVWFTGGKLKPVVSSQEQQENQFGGLREWKELFGAEHKRSWTEVMSNLGAQVFLGAELPQGMDSDGSMSYTLHRPYGGHGKGFVDILYLDDNLFITKGNHGTIHVMYKENI